METLKILTSRFGELEVPSDSVIEIVGGIIGFPEASKYIVLDYNPPFSWLQSTENPELAFVIVNGGEFGEHYKVPNPVGDRDIDLQPEDDVAILNLVSIRPDPTMTTVNLKAPVLVNSRNKKGRQMVLDDARYPTRFPLWSHEEDSGAS